MVMRGDADARGGQRDTGGDAAGAVADEHMAAVNAAGDDVVAAAVSGQAADGNDGGVGHARQNGLDEHLFLVTAVEALGDDMTTGEDHGDIVWRQADLTADEVAVGTDAKEVGGEGIDFVAADLVEKILLAVEVGFFHNIKIRQDQPSGSRPYQRNGDIGTQAAKSGDADL